MELKSAGVTLTTSRGGTVIVYLLALWIAAAPPKQIAAQNEPPTEYQVKAAYLLNFARFVEWPQGAFESANSPLRICVVGSDPFGNDLDSLVQGERIGNHPVVVARVRIAEALPSNCHVAFIPEDWPEQRRLIEALRPGVLTVGERPGFLDEGGIIGFVIENRRVRFDVSDAAAANSGLKLNSQLLKVARTVIPRAHP